MKNCLKTMENQDEYYHFFPWKIVVASVFQRRIITNEKLNGEIMGNLPGSMLPFSRSWKTFSSRKENRRLLAFGKKKKKKKKSSPVSGFRGETRARVVLLWRGGGAMAGVRSRIQKRRTSVGFGSRLATGRQLAPALSFPPPPIRVRLFPLLSALARLASSIASTSVTPFRDSSRVHSLHGILPRNIIQDPSSHHPPNREKTSSSSWMEWKRTWPRYIRECQILCLTWIIRIFGICFVQPKGLESSYSTQEEFYFILDLVYRFLFSLNKTRPFLLLSLEQEGSRKVGSDRFFDDNRVNDSSLSNSLSISLESSPSLRLETDAVIPPPRKLGLEFRTLRVAWQHRRAFDRARAIFPERNRSRNSIGRIFPSVNKEREERRNDGWPPIGLG